MPVGNEYIESVLLLHVAQGDEKAFTRLLVTHSGPLYSFLCKHLDNNALAEEIVQDVFTQIWQTRETLAEIRNFRTFLYVISRNRMLNELKKIARERKQRQEWISHQPSNSPLQEDQQTIEEQHNLVDNAISKLPPQQQKVWLLNRREGLTYKQIADEMHISRETVKTYLQLANQTIARFLSANLNG
ncbi:RNA polymerase sigma factor [Chitinophaga sp. Cy-1792]|uniref:RNA polymerase sigma factor n=1 Tax=Chitinophaga sp. Cy-1792 TaxID=2608339 RepID=UPI0014219289|nr:RNA polymerase sigma-70 factor [Chitinophaga sp. Cy-1792]